MPIQIEFCLLPSTSLGRVEILLLLTAELSEDDRLMVGNKTIVDESAARAAVTEVTAE